MSRVRRIFFSSALVLLVFAGLLPLAGMIIRSLITDGQFGFASYRGLLLSSRQWGLAGNSLILASLSTLAAVALGLPAGILIGRTDFPGRRALAAFLSVPLLLPPYLTALGWISLASRNGPLAGFIGIRNCDYLFQKLLGLPGSLLVLSTVFMPLVMLLTAAAFRAVPSRLEEAGLLAAPWPVVLLRISLPLALPGILLGAALVFLLALGEITVPPAFHFPVFAVESLAQFSAFYDMDAATAAAMPLALMTAVVLGIEAFSIRRIRMESSSGSGGAPLLIPLGKFRIPIAVSVWAPALMFAGFPLFLLVLQAGGLQSYRAALGQAGDSLLRGLVLAFGGGALLAAEGFFLAVFVRENHGLRAKAVDAATLFFFAIPGAVMGVGLIVLWNRPWTNIIYATPLILLLGYLGRFSAISLRVNRAFLELIPPALIEAARVGGIGWGRRLMWILIPAAWRGIAVAWLVGAVFCLRDVGMTLLIYPPGWDTLPVRIMTLAANGAPELIAALCVILLGATLIPLLLLLSLLGHKEVFR